MSIRDTSIQELSFLNVVNYCKSNQVTRFIPDAVVSLLHGATVFMFNEEFITQFADAFNNPRLQQHEHKISKRNLINLLADLGSKDFCAIQFLLDETSSKFYIATNIDANTKERISPDKLYGKVVLGYILDVYCIHKSRPTIFEYGFDMETENVILQDIIKDEGRFFTKMVASLTSNNQDDEPNPRIRVSTANQYLRMISNYDHDKLVDLMSSYNLVVTHDAQAIRRLVEAASIKGLLASKKYYIAVDMVMNKIDPNKIVVMHITKDDLIIFNIDHDGIGLSDSYLLNNKFNGYYYDFNDIECSGNIVIYYTLNLRGELVYDFKFEQEKETNIFGNVFKKMLGKDTN